MTISYMCAWCEETFEDAVKTEEHMRECSERPHNAL